MESREGLFGCKAAHLRELQNAVCKRGGIVDETAMEVVARCHISEGVILDERTAQPMQLPRLDAFLDICTEAVEDVGSCDEAKDGIS